MGITLNGICEQSTISDNILKATATSLINESSLTSVAAGNGINVSSVTGNSQTISLKLKVGTSTDIATTSTDCLEIKDMRSYWQTLKK